jgi:hypothetical protein
MEECLKLGDHFSYDFGDEPYSFPVETVIIHIDEEIAIVKVISITAECEDMTLEYDEVKEYFPDFTDPERDSNSRYLFLDMETLDLFDDPYNYYWEEQEDDYPLEETKEIDENAEEHSSTPTASDDLPF